MKIRNFALLMALVPTCVFAQFEVVSIEEVGVASKPIFSTKGDFLLLAGVDGQPGLSTYNLSSGAITPIEGTEAAAADPILSEGGSVVVFREVTYKNHLPHTSVKTKVIATGATYEVDGASRERQAYAFAGGKLKVVRGNTMLSKRLVTDVRKVEHEYLLTIEDMDLVLYNGNKRRVLNPQGKGSYIWESISPDQQHIVYMAIHKNCHTFVANIDGSNPVDLGYIGAPVWLGNDMVVGMIDLDDGHTLQKSELVVASIDGKMRQVLATPEQKRAIFPTANIEASAIAFENDGKVYILKFKKQ